MNTHSVLEDTAASSPNNSKQALDLYSNISSLQRLQEYDKCGSAMPMDYELILNNQIEQDRESETSPVSKTNWDEKDGDEAGYNEIVYDDQFCSTGCDKDVDCDMVPKDFDNSGIDKDEDCGVEEIKLQEENDPTYANDEISQSQKDQISTVDIETDDDSGMVTKHGEVHDKIEQTKNDESSRNNSEMLNVDCDKINNISCSEVCDRNSMLQQQDSSNVNSGSKNEQFDTDLFDIMSSDSEEELQLEIRYKQPFIGGKRSNETSKQKSSVDYSVKTNATRLKYEGNILSECEEKQVDDLNFRESELFVKNLEKSDTNFSDEPFCLQVSQDSGNIMRIKADESDFDRNVSNRMSKQPSQVFSNGCSSSDYDFDLLNSSPEKNLKKQMPSDNKCKVDSNIFRTQTYDSSSLELDGCDSLDGLYPVNSDGSSSYFQSITGDALCSSRLIRPCKNASLRQSFMLPPSKTLDNAMSTSSQLLDDNSNHFRASVIDSKTDAGSNSVAQDFLQISQEYACKIESCDSLKHLEPGQTPGPSSDISIAQYNCNSSSVSLDTTSLVVSPSLLSTQRQLSTSETQHLSDLPREELDMRFLTQTHSADQDNLLTTKEQPHMESSSPDSLINGREVDDPAGTVVSSQKLQIPSHSLECGDEQHHLLSNINVCNVIDNTHSIPSTSAYSPEKVAITATGVLEATKEHFSNTKNCSAAGSTSLFSLFQAPVSSPSPPVDRSALKTVTEERHIKSIMNTYVNVNHRLKSQDYSMEDIDNIADELATVLKSPRKRSHSPNHMSTAPTIKKPYLDGSVFTADAKDPSKESKMDMDVVNSPYVRLSSQTRNLVQEHDAVIRLCRICDTSGPGSRSIKCRNSHVICQSCLEDEIRLVMASEKMCLSCPEESCKVAIVLDSLSSVLPSLIVDFLRDNLRIKEQKASAKAVKKMQGLVICPRCSCPGLLEEHLIHFVCATCNSNCCRYCKASWMRNEEHEGCLLLSFVGTACFKDISKLPQNWNLSITPFNKNFLQVNVPLTSNEGSAVAAFFAKTSSGRSHVVQLFRIQNLKLWEKYVLKRKHVEDEIGAAELKEKFLFHGTKAENIVTICGEGFDMRVPTSNGALLGKGIYFSITAKYSEKYADKSGRMFLSRVICGWSQFGQRQLTRPQYHGTSRRMYDSCVDNVVSPTIYTVFDNTQCYPEYLIQFGN